jgi:maltooligosyltrehalose synthase
MSDSSVPATTYRLQFNRDFRFSDATALVDYLAKLGITDIYASPILTSRKGSKTVMTSRILPRLIPTSDRQIPNNFKANCSVDELKNSLSEDSPAYQEYSGIIAALSSLAEIARSEAEAEKRAIHERLQRLVAGSAEIAAFIDANIADFNGRPEDAASLCPLERLTNPRSGSIRVSRAVDLRPRKM